MDEHRFNIHHLTFRSKSSYEPARPIISAASNSVSRTGPNPSSVGRLAAKLPPSSDTPGQSETELPQEPTNRWWKRLPENVEVVAVVEGHLGLRVGGPQADDGRANEVTRKFTLSCSLCVPET